MDDVIERSKGVIGLLQVIFYANVIIRLLQNATTHLPQWKTFTHLLRKKGLITKKSKKF